MVARGWGRVVNIASTAGLTGYPYVAAYVAAKHGVVGLTRALALETREAGVTVNAVCPGYTDTELLRDSVRDDRREDRPQRSRRREPALHPRQPAGPAGDAGRGGRRGAVPVRPGLGRHDRPGDRGGRRRGDVMELDGDAPPVLDAETRAAGIPSEHQAELRLWLRLLTCTTLIEGEIRTRLRRTFDVTLPRFDLMAQLEKTPRRHDARGTVAAHDGVERQHHRPG